MPLSLHPAAVTLVLKKLSFSAGKKFICHFSTNTGSILSLVLRKEPDKYTSIIGAPYRQETEPDLGFFHTQGHPPMRLLGHWVHFLSIFAGLKRSRMAARMGNISESSPAVVQLVIHRLGRKK